MAQNNLTVANRGIIDANWQKFLQTSQHTSKTSEETNQEVKKPHYTGKFRRARKKKSLNIESVVTNVSDAENDVNNKVQTEEKSEINTGTLTNNSQPPKLTKFIAIDCEMVGIGFNGEGHMLARVSLVNKLGDCIYDKFVKAREQVVDYRTEISGVRKEDMMNGESFTVVQKEVADLLKGRILVGHSVKNDLSVLYLSHPKRNIRDTTKYKPFRKMFSGTPSLRKLTKEILGTDIQTGEHSSVEDARAAMMVYNTVSKKWEMSINQKRGHH